MWLCCNCHIYFNFGCVTKHDTVVNMNYILSGHSYIQSTFISLKNDFQNPQSGHNRIRVSQNRN